MVVIGGIALSVVVAGVSNLVIEAWLNRRGPRENLREPSQAYHGGSVADEAQRWLRDQKS